MSYTGRSHYFASIQRVLVYIRRF